MEKNKRKFDLFGFVMFLVVGGVMASLVASAMNAPAWVYAVLLAPLCIVMLSMFVRLAYTIVFPEDE